MRKQREKGRELAPAEVLKVMRHKRNSDKIAS
jgi:hypothetical protein